MYSKLIISYSGPNPKNDSDIDLKSLGRSLMGLDTTIEKLLRIIRIRGDIEIKATKTSKGSIEIEILIYFLQNFPFDSVESVIKLIQFCDIELYHKLINYWNEQYMNTSIALEKISFNQLFQDIIKLRSQFNEFLEENEDVSMILSTLLGIGLPKLFSRGEKQKEIAQTQDNKLGNIPQDYAVGLHKMIKNKGFHKTFKPFINQEFERIEIYGPKNIGNKTIIDGSNFDRYLSGLSEILPNFVNGKKYWVKGSIVNYQSAKGDSMKLHLEEFPKKYQLVTLYPHDEKTTKDYISFYQEKCNIYIEVLRKSVYQKPQFILHDIHLQQEKLFE